MGEKSVEERSRPSCQGGEEVLVVWVTGVWRRVVVLVREVLVAWFPHLQPRSGSMPHEQLK